MKNWRIGISLLLLLIYSLGMVHDLVPHFHLSDQVSKKWAEHVHDHEISHAGVWHIDHSDRSLYDFLICLLQHSDHPDFGDEKVPVTQPQFESGTSDYLLSFFPSFALPAAPDFDHLLIAGQSRYGHPPYIPPEQAFGTQYTRRGPPASFRS